MKLLGIDIGGTRIKAGIVNGEGKLQQEQVFPAPYDLPSLFFLLRKIKISFESFSHAGIGIPGLWDEKLRRIRISPNISYLKDAEIQEKIQDIFPEVKVHNDVTVATYGELLFGWGREFSSFLYLSIGTGIGGGIVIDGKIYTGKSGFAGEFGHMLVNPEGERCGCGSIGCFETEASATALVRKYKVAKKEKVSPVEIEKRALAGEKEANEAYRNVGEWLGRGISSLINIFDPEAVILGGGLSKAGELFIKSLKETLKINSYVYQRSGTKILFSSFGEMAGVVGAAAFGWKGIE